MNQERILDFAKTQLLSMGLTSISASTIALPNNTFETNGKSLWVELSCNIGSNLGGTETESHRIVIINHIVCVPANTETARANNIASKIMNIYNKYDSYRTGRFALGNGALLVVSETEQLDSDIVDNVYSTNVRVTFTMYKEGD